MFDDHQATMLNAYLVGREQELQRLRAENRKLRWVVVVLLLVGTLQWVVNLW